MGVECATGVGGGTEIKKQTNKSKIEKEADREKSREKKRMSDGAIVVCTKLLATLLKEHWQRSQIAIVRVGCIC